MRIALIGLPGSGKSTIGRQLARACALPFIDADQVVEERLGCSIAMFFEHAGEAAFRDVEAQVIDELTRSPAAGVLATGGGAVLRAHNRQCLRERACVYYLQSSPEEIAARLRQRPGARPLLQGQEPLQRLQQLLRQREALYLQTAHQVVPICGLALPQAVQRVRKHIGSLPAGGQGQAAVAS